MDIKDYVPIILPTRGSALNEHILVPFLFQMFKKIFVRFPQSDAVPKPYISARFSPYITGRIAQEKGIWEVISETKVIWAGVHQIRKRPSRPRSYTGAPTSSEYPPFLLFPPWWVAE
jgi:hypothetical protein